MAEIRKSWNAKPLAPPRKVKVSWTSFGWKRERERERESRCGMRGDDMRGDELKYEVKRRIGLVRDKKYCSSGELWAMDVEHWNKTVFRSGDWIRVSLL